MKIYINGTFYAQEDARISVLDHGLLYGDGIFEGIRLYQKCIFKLDEHLERLEYSAKAIRLTLPWTRQEIAQACVESCRANNLVDGYIRLLVTRGVGTLGLSPESCKDPQLIIIADTIQLYPKTFYTEGLKIITSPTWRNHHAALPPMVKSLNYLNNIMAKMDALQHGYHEALMLNDRGFIAECTGDNVFIVHKDVLLTPPVNAGSLAGITRGAVLEIARELGQPVVEKDLTRYDIWIADECFLTGTGAELVPVVEVDSRPIGTGKPGPHTHRFLERFHHHVTQDGPRI